MKQFRKIDIWVNGKYICSTTRSHNLLVARTEYLKQFNNITGVVVKCLYSQ